MTIHTFVKRITYFADTTLVNFSFGASCNTNVSQLFYIRHLIDVTFVDYICETNRMKSTHLVISTQTEWNQHI